MSEGNTTIVKTTSTGGLGFVGALTILFIALKLTGYISWSWVWVLAPLWISGLITAMIFGAMLTIFIVLILIAKARGEL